MMNESIGSKIAQAIQLIKSKVGIVTKSDEEKLEARESVKEALDLVDNQDVESQSLFFALSDDKVEPVIKEYVESEKQDLDRLSKTSPKEGIGKIFSGDAAFAYSIQEAASILRRLEKLNSIYSKRLDELEGEKKKYYSDLLEEINLSIKNWYDWASSTMGEMVSSVAKTDDPTSAEMKMDSAGAFSANAGGIVFNLVFDKNGKKGTAGDFMKETKKRTESQVYRRTKQKRDALRKIREALYSAMLPAFTGSEIKREGDYYKLFKTLREERKDWMDTILLNKIFKSNTDKFNTFKSKLDAELPNESYQTNYLDACELWIVKFIESDYLGEFNEREERNSKSSMESIVSQKRKEIKNFYLSRGFNLGRFAAVRVEPEIDLPLYQSVKIAVSDADRLDENPFQTIKKGVGGLLWGAIGTQGVDMAALAAGKENHEQNKALFRGLHRIVKGSVGLIGGKEAARKYEKGVRSATDSTLTRALGLTASDEDKPLKEDMLGPADSPGYSMQTIEGPGSTFQTPGTVPSGMDTFSLLGPGKKTKKRSKKRSKSKSSSRVLTFGDFIKGIDKKG